jgi:hypothetical protein
MPDFGEGKEAILIHRNVLQLDLVKEIGCMSQPNLQAYGGDCETSPASHLLSIPFRADADDASTINPGPC